VHRYEDGAAAKSGEHLPRRALRPAPAPPEARLAGAPACADGRGTAAPAAAVPPAAPAAAARHATRCAATQSLYRDGEAQTAPYEPAAAARAPLGAKQRALCSAHHCAGPEVRSRGAGAELPWERPERATCRRRPPARAAQVWELRGTDVAALGDAAAADAVERLRARRAFLAALPPLMDARQARLRCAAPPRRARRPAAPHSQRTLGAPRRQRLQAAWEAAEWEERGAALEARDAVRLAALQAALDLRRREARAPRTVALFLAYGAQWWSAAARSLPACGLAPAVASLLCRHTPAGCLCRVARRGGRAHACRATSAARDGWRPRGSAAARHTTRPRGGGRACAARAGASSARAPPAWWSSSRAAAARRTRRWRAAGAARTRRPAPRRAWPTRASARPRSSPVLGLAMHRTPPAHSLLPMRTSGQGSRPWPACCMHPALMCPSRGAGESVTAMGPRGPAAA